MFNFVTNIVNIIHFRKIKRENELLGQLIFASRNVEATQAHDHLHFLLEHHVWRTVHTVPGGHISDVEHPDGRRMGYGINHNNR